METFIPALSIRGIRNQTGYCSQQEPFRVHGANRGQTKRQLHSQSCDSNSAMDRTVQTRFTN